MKKRKSFFIILLVFTSSLNYAQYYQLRGLEIYNPAYTNPAFVQAEKNVQLDMIGYNINWQSGIWTNAMLSLPKYHSSFGVQFSNGAYRNSYSWNSTPFSGEKTIVYNSIKFNYAYHHSFSEDLKLTGGLSFNSSKLNYIDTIPGPEGELRQYLKQEGIGLGVSLEYKKFYTGVSVDLPFNARIGYLMPDNTMEMRKTTYDLQTFHFRAGYSIGGERRVTLDPVLGLDYWMGRNSDYSELKGYVGANVKFMKTFCVGFTMGNLLSFSTSLNLFDRVTLGMGVYAGEHDLLDYSRSFGAYSLSFSDFNVIGQIRVKL